METRKLQEATCRIAFAAYVHDLGKLAERARIDVGREKLDYHKQQYCPQNWQSKRWTHIHAAYTALAFGRIEHLLPAVVGNDVTPFGAWMSTEVSDSLVNAAAFHHKPDTFLQWVVATADRVASGFERDAFEQYNQAEEQGYEGLSHYRARLLPLFENIRLGERQESYQYRYPLAPASVDALFPQARSDAVPADNATAQQQYRHLWDTLLAAMETIPGSHRDNWPLWLDHFDSLWATVAQSIPSATAGAVKPDVSLYDHCKTTSALAAALWRYHEARGDQPAAATAMRHRQDWDEQKFLLVQGDVFGIQEFIFSGGSQTQKQAARLLRGRSFYVSLMTECAALRVLDALALAPTSLVTQAAGKFLLVAPNTGQTREALERLRQEFDTWSLEHTYGQTGLGLAWQPACCNDFVCQRADGGFKALIGKLFAQLERAKFGRSQLCGDAPPPAVQGGYLEAMQQAGGACAFNDSLPADGGENRDGHPQSRLSADQIAVGDALADASRQRLLLLSEPIQGQHLQLPLFGYHIHFTGPQESSGKFGAPARDGVLRRALDISLPAAPDTLLFQGYARRAINAYVPLVSVLDLQYAGKYGDLAESLQAGQLKPLDAIACENRMLMEGESERWQGIRALAVLKGDVDNLGALFEAGLAQPSFAKMAALSRQLNHFFATWLPCYCRQHAPDTYTVFAGGDDFFLIGPWLQTQQLALAMRRAFSRYVAANPDLHFSAGIAQYKPGVPVRTLAEQGEHALELAKSACLNDAGSHAQLPAEAPGHWREVDLPDTGYQGKDAISLYGLTLTWKELEEQFHFAAWLEQQRQALGLSSGFIYELIEVCRQAEQARAGQQSPENGQDLSAALWRSHLCYRTYRWVADQHRARGERSPEEHRRWIQQRASALAGDLGRAIGLYGETLRVALYQYFYRHRS